MNGWLILLFALALLVAQPCPTLRDPHGLWPTKLLCPWDSPGKNTGVWKFPGGPVAKTLRSQRRGPGLDSQVRA